MRTKQSLLIIEVCYVHTHSMKFDFGKFLFSNHMLLRALNTVV